MLKLLTFIVALAACPLATIGQTIPDSSFRQDPDGPTRADFWAKDIEIGPGLRIPASISVTTRRNGSLKVANLSLRVVDQYDDSAVYEGGKLHVEFTDLTGDGLTSNTTAERRAQA